MKFSDDNDFGRQLMKQAEGKLYVHRFVTFMKSVTAFYNESYYVVRKGVVFSCHIDKEGNYTETPSGDSVTDLVTQAELIGDYEREKVKKDIFEQISYKKLQKAFLPKQIVR